MNAKVLTPEEAPQKIANIQQIIVAINSLSKVLLMPFYLLVNMLPG